MSNQKSSKHFPTTKGWIVFYLVLVLLIGFLIFGVVDVWENQSGDESVACTMDAKLCADGSAVGRVGPDCEFAECPALSSEMKEEMVSNYIEENISKLSPEPEVLGGTFYVTSIEFVGESSGVVEYEDGHIALVADFEYSVDKETGAVEVTLENVRE